MTLHVSLCRSGATARRLLIATLALAAGHAIAQSPDTAFTYQGQLTEAGQPALGLYDLQVCLYDAASAGTEIGCAPNLDDVPVEDGAFTIPLDFGAAPFIGQPRWIELRIRDGAGTGGYTILSPRQLIRPAPEALRANRADAAASADSALVADTALTADSAPWSGLSGIPAGFADGIDDDSGGTVTSIEAGTGLEGGTITGSGTIGIADGGVGSAQIAPGAVGAIQIDPNQVQARLNATCPDHQFLQGIALDGSPQCLPLPLPTRSYRTAAAADLAESTALAIGLDGFPVVAYSRGVISGSALGVSACLDPACADGAFRTTVQLSGRSGGLPAIRIGPAGLPTIAYLNGGTFDEPAAYLAVARCQDPRCERPATITALTDYDPLGDYISMALTVSGNPVIAFGNDADDALSVARCTNAACTGSLTLISTVDDPPGGFILDTSIALPADGLPVIAYHDSGNDQLKVAKCTNVACADPATINVVTSIVPATLDVSLTIGSDGLPIIAYGSEDSAGLFVAKCTDAACSAPAIITLVDASPNGAGADPSLTIGADGLPVIAYRDPIAGRLKVAKCAALDCSAGTRITAVPSFNGSEGLGASIGIGPDGLPVISHIDESTDRLIVTRCGTPDCR